MTIGLNVLIPFSASRRVFRAYGHAMVAESGLVAVVPLAAIDGPLQGLEDGCPVSWDEACAVIAARPAAGVALDSPDFGSAVARLRALAPDGWQMATLPELRSVVFCHPCGVRVAMTADLAFRVECHDQVAEAAV